MPRQESPRTRALQPMPSHQQVVKPQTNASMRAFKGRLLRPGEEFDPNNKLVMSPEAPKIKEFRGTPLGPGDEQYVDESPEGITSPAELLSKFSPILPSIGDVGGASKAVAYSAGTPQAIKFLKERGLKNVQKILAEGLEQRSLGLRPKMANVSPSGTTTTYGPDYVPNVTPNPKLEKALLVAQARWPRLFGHINDITDIDAIRKLKATSQGKVAYGGMQDSSVSPKLGTLSVNPKASGGDTVGHELSHLRAKLLDKDFRKKYDETLKTTGYEQHPEELRARVMGARFRQILAEVEKQGGFPRDKQGRNIRVGWPEKSPHTDDWTQIGMPIPGFDKP